MTDEEGRSRIRWGVGLENTAIGVAIRHSGRTLDEFELTEHDQRIEADLELAASLGSTVIRYGPPWYRVNPAPGVFVWDLVDRAVQRATSHGMEPIIDLVHYGVPGWVTGGFLDAAYPEAVAAYGSAFATRYRGTVRHYTPLNEPTVTAAFCGETGGWPPYASGLRGWTDLVLSLADGIQRTIAAIRSAEPDAVIVHVEQSKILRHAPAELAEARRLAELRAWLPTDLVLGRVDKTYPLAEWLVGMGVTTRHLRRLRANAAEIDVMGVNFYPQYSVRDLVVHDGEVREVSGGGTAEDLVTALRRFADRYERPVAVTETSYDGDDAARIAWLQGSATAIRRAAAAGLDVWGYVWWPLFDFVDWGIAQAGYTLEDFLVRLPQANGTELLAPPPPPGAGVDPTDGVGPWLRRMGLWRLEPTGGRLERIETLAADEFRHVAAADSLSGRTESRAE